MSTGPIQQAASICRDSRRMQAILRLHGITSQITMTDSTEGISSQPTETFLRKYKVQLYQYHVLLFDRMEGTGVWLQRGVTNQEQEVFERISYSSEELEHKKVVQLAIRSIYALGLDFGTVIVGVNSPTKITVLEVHPDISPLARAAMDQEENLVGWQDVRKVHVQPIPHVMLGADPEFALRTEDGKMGMASRFLEKQGIIGYDAARYRETVMHDLHPLVEIRPAPAYSPREVFRHILQAMRIGMKKLPANMEWLAGGMPFFGYPIGGHIHFSGVKLSFSLLRCLDTYLALPLALIEDEGCKRRRSRYGFLGDYREQPYGGFEYRTLPSWLVSPLVTQGVLALAKVVATHHHELTLQPILQLPVQKAYYQGDKTKLQTTVQQLWKELVKLSTYQEYQIELDAFYYCLKTSTSWQSDQDIRVAWGLISHSTTPVKHAIIQGEKMPSR